LTTCAVVVDTGALGALGAMGALGELGDTGPAGGELGDAGFDGGELGAPGDTGALGEPGELGVKPADASASSTICGTQNVSMHVPAPSTGSVHVAPSVVQPLDVGKQAVFM